MTRIGAPIAAGKTMSCMSDIVRRYIATLPKEKQEEALQIAEMVFAAFFGSPDEEKSEDEQTT